MNTGESIDPRVQLAKRFGIAWLALAISLALHVTDEALTGFLAVWNFMVLAVRERVSWSPLPTFTFGIWITGLAALVGLLLLVSPLAFRGVRWFAFLASAFSGLMIGNGLLHLGVSLARGHLLPGFWSSPVLVATSAVTLMYASRFIRKGKVGPATTAANPGPVR